jgi:ribosomal protein S18 acetylase RimI-like enzyme
MLTATTVHSTEELEQIHQLNRQNLKQHLDARVQAKEGFVSWLYTADLLEKMHRLAPSIIVKDRDRVVAYALTALIESSAFHPDLASMFAHLEKLMYKDRPLFDYRFYCMGQICVAKEYRGNGLVQQLYEQHRACYGNQYDFLLTEVATRNQRSLRAHEKLGFHTIHTYHDAQDEWQVIIWDWK